MTSEPEFWVELLRPVFLLFKGIAAGIVFVLLAWGAVLIADNWRMRNYLAKRGTVGLGAVAGGWQIVLQSPFVVLILAAAFGIGFYLAIRLSIPR